MAPRSRWSLDDAHLADEATIDVLHHLGSAGGTPVLAVLAYRPEPAPEALTRGVARLARAGKAVEIDLGPLDREDAAALVAAGAPTPRAAEVVDRIVDLAQGNPFLTLELAQSAVAGVPALVATARDAVAARFLDLDEDTLAMLRRLALAGDDLDPASVVALTGSSEAEAFALLDVALERGGPGRRRRALPVPPRARPPGPGRAAPAAPAGSPSIARPRSAWRAPMRRRA